MMLSATPLDAGLSGHVDSLLQQHFVQSQQGVLSESSVSNLLVRDDQGRIGVNVRADDVATLLPNLAQLGFVEHVVSESAVEGWLPVDAIDEVDQLVDEGLRVLEAQRPLVTHSSGLFTSQGDNSQFAERVRSFSSGGDPIDGTGITVAILSDSFEHLSPLSATTEVPADTLIVAPAVTELISGVPLTDEGRAIAEIIHDLAPGANIAFAAGANTQTGMVTQLDNLVSDARAQWPTNRIIVIDNITLAEEFTFQAGPWADRIEELVNPPMGSTDPPIAYIAAAGNQGALAWENIDSIGARLPFNPTEGEIVFNGAVIADDFHTFRLEGGGDDFRQRIVVEPGSRVDITLSWDQPEYHVTSCLLYTSDAADE